MARAGWKLTRPAEGELGHLTLADCRIDYASSVDPAVAQAWLEGWRNWFDAARAPLPGAPKKQDLALVSSPLGRLVAKRSVSSGLRGPLEALHLRPTRAERSFHAARALRGVGLAAPEPLASLASKRPGEPRTSCFVARFVEGFSPWSFVLRGGEEARHELARALGDALAKLHEAGLRHRDLKEPNLIVARDGEGVLRVWFVDLDGVAAERRVSESGARRDLARLGVSFRSVSALAAGVKQAHWREVVVRYLGARRGERVDEGRVGIWLQQTEALARAKIERNRKMGRPVA